MLKSHLLAVLQQEIRPHDFSYFIDQPPSMAQCRKGVCVPGCSVCRKQINTMNSFVEHLAVDEEKSLEGVDGVWFILKNGNIHGFLNERAKVLELVAKPPSHQRKSLNPKGVARVLQPLLGPIRVAVLMAIVQTPHRFRTKRMLWKYSGFGVVTQTSADHQYVNGQLQRTEKPVFVRGLEPAHNHQLKAVFKSAAIQASTTNGPFRKYYEALVAKGMRPEMARLTLARKIATISWMVWRKGVAFEAKYLNPQTA